MIPAFNESDRIGPFLDDLGRQFKTVPAITVQVVDDGSDTAEAAAMADLIEMRRPAMAWLLPIHRLPHNLGKGAAVRAGWDLAQEQTWLGFADADGATPAREVQRLIEHIRSQPNTSEPTAVFASRILMLGRQVDRQARRHMVGRVFATLVSALLNIRAYDTQCGCKFVPTAAYREVRDGLQCDGFSFDVELLVALLDRSWDVREEPVDWSEIPGGKVRLLRDSWRMFRELLDIRARRGAAGAARPE